MAQIIDGKAISQAVKDRVGKQVAELKEKGITPGLAVIIVGADPASLVYVGSKKRACAALGMYSEEHALPKTVSQEELLALVECLNNRSDINGILCQLPLPKHL
ncbi:MAG: tetrahydrofolate dehydrogenase/cyclohydrolase catalytic domain-containing protein, partial [Selenomonadaceae bacterium]